LVLYQIHSLFNVLPVMARAPHIATQFDAALHPDALEELASQSLRGCGTISHVDAPAR
jgi:hypothetical protein